MTDATTAARVVFDNLCVTAESLGCAYEKNEKAMCVSLSVRGDDLPIRMDVRVDAARSLVILISPIPIEVPQEKRLDMALAVCKVNRRLSDGSFDYDIGTGRLSFRIADSFIGKSTGGEVLEYMMYYARLAVDEYNDRFLLLSCGRIDTEQF